MSIVLDGTNGITTLDGEVYAEGNILGTVAQTGGVPTGAIIENGSNANGEFVKYADGTMICTGVVNIIPVANTPTNGTFTFPATFSANPLSVAATYSNAAAITRPATITGTLSTTSVDISIIRSNTTATDNNVVSIGRWF
jgi:hypothetical protein